jgi:PKD repeat protein
MFAMKSVIVRVRPVCIAFFLVCGITTVAFAKTVTLRIVTYNIMDDINGFTTPLAGLITPFGGGGFTSSSSGTVTNGGVLEGIGEEIVGSDPAQPLDILALEETTSNPTTVAPIVSGLNTFYNTPGMYAMSPYQATEESGILTNGNGPNALVYNTKTVQLVASVPVDPPGGTNNLGATSGEYREVMRYELAPANVMATSANEFYIYVSHYKAKTTATDMIDRTGEATIIRNDEATHLSANARVIYIGDYNISTSGEISYQIILSNSAPNGVKQGQGIDLFNLSGATNIDWSANSLTSLKSETATALEWRFDLQLMTSNVYNGVAGGLAYVPGTYHVFGNNGTVPFETSVTFSNNTALNHDLVTNAMISASQLYTNLTGASDHLPTVADYTVTIPDPPVASFTGSPTSGIVPLAVNFTDMSSGSITNWSWNFGDGGATNLATNSVSYIYNTAGVYTVREIVSGPGGSGTNTQVNYITVLTPFQAWQIQYFGSTTNPAAAANADPDGDGQNNLAEFLAGTNPTNNASGLRITSVTTQGSGVLLTWRTAGGETNVVQSAAGLPDGSYSTNFVDLSPAIIISGSGDVITNYLDSGGATNIPARYYRVRLQP